ncbi:hypothetical protein POM88_025441 [Heracleum sosnowskyi]|uniref:Uncharacterized protein n=1 Tax=Heracleum sosnowskyi TaxID=360622 RepID=A0AAD8I403_9APIA|nr:hypothetical protein POM88_025441 [Heracleum sosnowskyi]
MLFEDLQVKSELPSTFQAFRFQQHRWSCGPANLFRKMFMEIIRNKTVTCCNPKMGSSLYPCHHHCAQCSWNSKVHALANVLELFENVMALHRTKATLIGLLETGRANEWVVTEKQLGDASATKKKPQKTPKRARFRLGSRLHMLELAVSAYLFGSACYDYTHENTRYFIYLYIQSMAFLIMGCGYVGTIVPSS